MLNLHTPQKHFVQRYNDPLVPPPSNNFFLNSLKSILFTKHQICPTGIHFTWNSPKSILQYGMDFQMQGTHLLYICSLFAAQRARVPELQLV